MKPWNYRLGKTAQILLILNFGFILGRYSESFSGRTSAWLALIACVLGLVTILFMLIWDVWQSDIK